MDTVRKLLLQAITKQQQLYPDPRWAAELLPYAPPVLWFGDLNSPQPKIVTIGANPSRREFLPSANANQNVYNNYLVGHKARFYVSNIPFANLLNIPNQTLDDIIKSYDDYFTKNPYAIWFGNHGGGKVEALINGLGASFYSNSYDYRGIHIDLFPFATMSNYTRIINLCNKSLFHTNWAQNFLLSLIQRIKPEKLIIFGISNYRSILRIFNKQDVVPRQINVGTKTCEVYYNVIGGNLPIIGLYINLGNPIGWSRQELIQLGNSI